MCLAVKELPQVCKKTMVVYKEIKIEKGNNILLKTPYRGTLIVSPLMIATPVLSKEYIKNINTYTAIREGFIHSYRKHVNTFMDRAVVKAYIPKGTIYIIGEYYDIASTQLILDPRDVYKYTGYKFPLSDRIKFFLWRIIHLIK